MKKILTIFTLVIFCGASPVFAEDTVAVEQAKSDYKVYLQELKKLGAQYQQITGQMKQTIQEEGYPVWDEETGTFKISHSLEEASTPVSMTTGVTFHEKDRELIANVELPGLKKDSLNVRIQDEHWLRVNGVRKADGAKVDRVIELPSRAGEGSPKAVYEDGVLIVTVPKASAAKREVTVPVR